jgi:hypothetical protein
MLARAPVGLCWNTAIERVGAGRQHEFAGQKLEYSEAGDRFAVSASLRLLDKERKNNRKEAHMYNS